MNSMAEFQGNQNTGPVKHILRRATVGDILRVKRRRFWLYSLATDEGWTSNTKIPYIDLEEGALFVNGIHVLEPRITHDHITWLQHAQEEAGTHYLAGHLHMHCNGIEAHGSVVVGRDHRDAIRYDVFAVAIPNVRYETLITSTRHPIATDPTKLPPEAWQKGPDLELGYRQQVGDSVPKPVVNMAGQDISDLCTWSADDRSTKLRITMDDSYCALAPELYAQADLSFDHYLLDAPGNGLVRTKCGETAAKDDTAYFWKATVSNWLTCVSEVSPLLFTSPSRKMVAKEQLLSTANDDLTINELMTLLPDDLVNEDANSMLMRNMKWAMGQDATEKKWLSDFFNETPPPITEPNQVVLVKQSLSWYQNKFAKAYLAQSFNSYSGPNEPDHRLSGDQAVKLSNYLKTGLAKESDFNIQHRGIFIDAYVGVKTRLKSYINDDRPEYVGWAQGTVIFSRKDAGEDVSVPAGVIVKTAQGVVFMTTAQVSMKKGSNRSEPVAIVACEAGRGGVVAPNAICLFADKAVPGIDSVANPAVTTLSADKGGVKWAKKLFAALTTGSQFVLMVNRVAGAAGDPKALGPVNNFACLLTALDPLGKTAENYYNSVMSGLIVKLTPQVVHSDKDTIMQWLPATMQELFRKMANGELPDEAKISSSEAKELYQEFLQHQADITSATAELLQSIVAQGLIKQGQVAEAQYAETVAARWPKMAKAAPFMLAIGWIGGISSVIVSLIKGDWKKMNDRERGEFVTNCVQLAVTGFDAVPLIWQGVKNVSLSMWNKLNNWWNAPQQQGEIAAQRVNAGENPVEDSANLENVFREAEQTGETLGKGTIFERLFAEGVFKGVLKAVGALAAAAMVYFSTRKLIDDCSGHGSVSTIVFDWLTLAANFLSAVCLVADLFIATSFLPIAGAVFAICGILIGILASFFEKPANALGNWIRDHGAPFVDGLPAQTTSVAAARLQSLTA